MLLSVISKVMGRIVIDRIRTGVESKLREEQAGFQPARRITKYWANFPIINEISSNSLLLCAVIIVH